VLSAAEGFDEGTLASIRGAGIVHVVALVWRESKGLGVDDWR